MTLFPERAREERKRDTLHFRGKTTWRATMRDFPGKKPDDYIADDRSPCFALGILCTFPGFEMRLQSLNCIQRSSLKKFAFVNKVPCSQIKLWQIKTKLVVAVLVVGRPTQPVPNVFLLIENVSLVNLSTTALCAFW